MRGRVLPVPRIGARAAWTAGILVVLPMMAACSSQRASSPTTAKITVLAAASLTEAFRAAGAAFLTIHNVQVTFSFGASSTLAAQIVSGSPGDVFASADERTMKRAVDAGDVAGSPQIFATNRLAVAVAPGNPEHIGTLADLARPGLRIALCAAQVPCGTLADQTLVNAHVTVAHPSRELDVKAVVTKVRLGEADAGIVYTTDVLAAAGSVAGVAIPDAQNVVARYPIAVLKGASSSARTFVDFIISPDGAAILRRFGFGVP